MRLAIFLLACSAGTPHSEVLAPFDGSVHRYAVDSLRLPDDRYALGDDLDGDGGPDDQLANILGGLEIEGCAPVVPEDQVASGAIASVLEIQTGNFRNDSRAGARYQGTDVANGDFVGGVFASADFLSNRTRDTRHPANMTVRLPLFVDADPIDVPLTGVEIDVKPGDNLALEGTLRGAIRKTNLDPILIAGFLQMLHNNPAGHIDLLPYFDLNNDGAITADELPENNLYLNLTNPDSDLFDAQGSWGHDGVKESIGVVFAFHAVPCDAGRCSNAVPGDLCHDRVTDGDESDHDCGGSCLRCARGKSCRSGGDCQSGQCSSGVCG